MKPSNTKFWTRDSNGQRELRDLHREEGLHRHNLFPSWREGIIDEPVLIYYEVYDCHSSFYIDDCIYQANQCFIKPGDVVLDLGGNIGIFSRFASDKGAKKIYTFEPVQENFQLLALNRPENCEAHRLAVADKDNQALKISYKENCPGGSSIVKYDDGVLQTCMSITLDTLIANGVIEQPDFIKMDIEGAEVYAFKGISDEYLKKVRCIAMEMHMPTIGQEGADYIYNRLVDLGFDKYTVNNPDQCNIVYFTNKALI